MKMQKFSKNASDLTDIFFEMNFFEHLKRNINHYDHWFLPQCSLSGIYSILNNKCLARLGRYSYKTGTNVNIFEMADNGPTFKTRF